MRFSRHAKNRMRWARLDHETVELLVDGPEAWEIDQEGNPVVVARDADNRLIRVVIALDDPDFVITVIARDRR